MHNSCQSMQIWERLKRGGQGGRGKGALGVHSIFIFSAVFTQTAVKTRERGGKETRIVRDAVLNCSLRKMRGKENRRRETEGERRRDDSLAWVDVWMFYAACVKRSAHTYIISINMTCSVPKLVQKLRDSVHRIQRPVVWGGCQHLKAWRRGGVRNSQSREEWRSIVWGLGSLGVWRVNETHLLIIRKLSVPYCLVTLA